MKNKTAKILLALALGGAVIWIISRAKEALARPETVITPTPLPEVKPPKWEITEEKICYRTGSLVFCLPNPVGGILKPQDQALKEAIEAQLQMPTYQV